MSQRSRDRSQRRRRAESSSARRPVRSRRDTTRSVDKVRPRGGFSAKRAAGAAKVLGMSNTRRAAIVAIVICALAFTVAVPLRTYLTQRSEISEQAAQRAELQRQVAELETRQGQLADPGQIEAEARRRLRFVMPGETPYMIQLPEDKPQAQLPKPQEAVGQGPWYELLWKSVSG